VAERVRGPATVASADDPVGGALRIIGDEAEGSDDSGCCGPAGGDPPAGGCRVGTIVISPKYGATGGFRSATPHNHYSLLRTIEDAWGLELLGHAKDAAITPMSEFFAAR